ncbi:MAG: hypothetical protein J1F17_05710 [Oscillospiraceae bacterium]|nr:hypothetical protein [Oscillospiraceae bacterium]
MKSSKKIVCAVLAVIMAVSSIALGSVSASAATAKAPKTVTVANAENGIKVTWSKVSKAKKYVVIRNKKKIATVKKRSYLDITAKAGKTYTYKVKAVNGKAKAAAKITRLNKSFITALTNAANGIKINWFKKVGATEYRVFRKTTGKYSKIATVKGKYTYTDKTTKSGVKYTYVVKAYNKKTKSVSTYLKKSRTYLAAPSNVTARENVAFDGITVNWDKVTGATGYAVYRQKCTENSYSKIATVSGGKLTYNDTAATQINPTAYMYKVVALKGSEKSAASIFRLAPYAAKGEGENRYYRDSANNLHIKIYLNKGESYADGKALADYLSLTGQYKAEVTQGADKVKVENGVITAVETGDAVVEVTVSDAGKDIINGASNDGATKLSTKTVYIEVNVK